MAASSDSTPPLELSTPEPDVAAWIKTQLDNEINRVRTTGGKAIPIPVKNMGVVREDAKPNSRTKKKATKKEDTDRDNIANEQQQDDSILVNRIEFNTSQDFGRVKEVMLSNSIDCPVKQNYKYVNVVLYTGDPLVMMFGYLYENVARNDLSQWLFINNQTKRSRQTVKAYKEL
jgi:hypothetical protein